MAKKIKKKKYLGAFELGRKTKLKDFTSEKKFIEYVFEKNINKILAGYREDKPYITKAEAKRKFIAKVKTTKEIEKINIRKAITLVSQTRTFTTATEMGLINIKNNIGISKMNKLRALQAKANKTPYNQTSINWGEYQWRTEHQAYVHMSGTFMIGWTHSGNSTEEDWIFVEEI